MLEIAICYRRHMKDEKILLAVETLDEMCLPTNISSIARESGADEGVLRVQLRRLSKNELLYSFSSMYILTDKGRDLLDNARVNQYPVENWGAFSDEVLTGMDKNGFESSFINPVLPKSHDSSYFGNHTEDKFIRAIKQDGLVRDLIQTHPWLSVDKLSEYWSNNQIVECAKCGNMAVHSMSRYRSSGLSKYCINCQREKRKK